MEKKGLIVPPKYLPNWEKVLKEKGFTSYVTKVINREVATIAVDVPADKETAFELLVKSLGGVGVRAK
jgi:hypothetical protein